MNENRRKILQMLAAGHITADEAERLLSAMEKEPATPLLGESPEPRIKPRPKYLRVLVEAESSPGSERMSTVNIRVPMQLLRSGVRLTSFIPAEARDRVNDAMRNEGMKFDLNQLKPENLEELIEQLDDISVDVGHENKKARVKVFCE